MVTNLQIVIIQPQYLYRLKAERLQMRAPPHQTLYECAWPTCIFSLRRCTSFGFLGAAGSLADSGLGGASTVCAAGGGKSSGITPASESRVVALEFGGAGRPSLCSLDDTAGPRPNSLALEEERGAGEVVCAGGVGRPSTNLEGGVAGSESGATGCGDAEVPVCTVVLRLAESLSFRVMERVEVESVSGGSEPACASVLKFVKPLPVSCVAKGGRGGISSASDEGRYAATL